MNKKTSNNILIFLLTFIFHISVVRSELNRLEIKCDCIYSTQAKKKILSSGTHPHILCQMATKIQGKCSDVIILQETSENNSVNETIEEAVSMNDKLKAEKLLEVVCLSHPQPNSPVVPRRGLNRKMNFDEVVDLPTSTPKIQRKQSLNNK